MPPFSVTTPLNVPGFGFQLAGGAILENDNAEPLGAARQGRYGKLGFGSPIRWRIDPTIPAAAIARQHRGAFASRQHSRVDAEASRDHPPSLPWSILAFCVEA